jgi:hypothetical protein
MEQTPQATVLDARECWSLLGSTPFGRLAIAGTGESPRAFPVNFRVHGPQIVFRSAGGTKLAAVSDGAPVAFEADDVDTDTGVVWSVVARGPWPVAGPRKSQPTRSRPRQQGPCCSPGSREPRNTSCASPWTPSPAGGSNWTCPRLGVVPGRCPARRPGIGPVRWALHRPLRSSPCGHPLDRNPAQAVVPEIRQLSGQCRSACPAHRPMRWQTETCAHSAEMSPPVGEGHGVAGAGERRHHDRTRPRGPHGSGPREAREPSTGARTHEAAPGALRARVPSGWRAVDLRRAAHCPTGPIPSGPSPGLPSEGSAFVVAGPSGWPPSSHRRPDPHRGSGDTLKQNVDAGPLPPSSPGPVIAARISSEDVGGVARGAHRWRQAGPGRCPERRDAIVKSEECTEDEASGPGGRMGPKRQPWTFPRPTPGVRRGSGPSR